MSQFIIEGGQPLNGTITASGNKNAALKLLPACILTSDPVTLHNIPDIVDVRNTLKLLKAIGVEVTDLGKGSFRIQAKNIAETHLPAEIALKTRASFVFSGPLLSRMGEAGLPLPGGDLIGGRPLDTHMQGLLALGVTVDQSKRGWYTMHGEKMHACGYILQAEASVTATENTLMAAVLQNGETVIDNAAREPHVVDLCELLNKMGAQIEGVGTSRLIIQGVSSMYGAEHRIGADFMEVGSFIGAAAVTHGNIRIQKADPNTLRMVRLIYQKLGVEWEVDGEDIIVGPDQELHIAQTLSGGTLEIKPMPWPGFPPDLMSILVLLATQSEGTVLLHDWMYESRFFFVDRLNFMGARTTLCDPHRLIVNGRSQLHAPHSGIASPDIRAGMAMLLAALCAKGETTISNINQIDRGYEHVEHKLRTLGANIRRVN